MGYCRVCGGGDRLPYTCNFCGGKFCSNHRLPEKHNCGMAARSSDVHTSSKFGTVRDEGDTSATANVLLLPLGVAILGIQFLFGLIRWLVSPSGFKILCICIVVAVGVSATVGTGYGPLDSVVDDTISGLESTVESATPDRDELDRSQIEQQVHFFINEERSDQGLRKLHFDDDLGEIARSHSDDMAHTGYFAHESPSSETMDDRYERFGYECRVAAGGSMYYAGAENIAYTYAYSDIVAEHGRSSNHQGNETRIARGLVDQWMNSPGHRENILGSYWENEGIGVTIVEVDGNTRVYATQNFC